MLAPYLINQQKAEFSKCAAYLRPLLQNKLKDASKSGHVRALKRTIASELRVRRYEDLSYSVANSPDGSLILGDSVVLFSVEGPKPYKAFLDKDDTLTAVYLPIDSGKVLIGTRPGFASLQYDLRAAIARCSLEYFIANEKTSPNESLQEQIGADAWPLTQEELEQIFIEVIQR
jgi:hypothetical protein